MSRASAALMKIKFFTIIILLFALPPVAQAAVYTDEMGAAVQVDTPRRIISLSPAITEILFALGLGEQVVGVTKFSDYPAGAKNKPQVGSYVNLNLERIVSLKPDLVLSTADGNPKDAVYRLRGLGLAVFVINPHSFDDIFKSILHIGQITGRPEEAKVIVERMKQRKKRIQELTATQQKVRVFVQIEPSPLITVGKKTFWDHLISLAGGENIAQDAPIKYPRYSLEEVVIKNPQVIIITSMLRQDNQRKSLSKWSKWQSIPAVRNKRVYTINPDLVDRPGPRVIEGLEQLARFLHPQLFTPNNSGENQ